MRKKPHIAEEIFLLPLTLKMTYDSYNNLFDLDIERSYPTPFQNSPLLPLLLMSLAVQKHTPDTKRTFRRQYDYVVVGAGSAGSVVAARLSEDPSKTVLLLEAGKSPPLLTAMPATYGFLTETDLFWNHSTVPQKYAGFGHLDQRVDCGMGKTIGGSSVLNGMLYVRGNRKDYDTWERMGASGWDWSGVFPYFLKSECNTDPNISHNGFHSRHGPMTIGTLRSMSEFESRLKDSVLAMGYPHRDINGKRQSGFSITQGNVRKGQRVSTAKAYLVLSEKRPNLHIVAEAYVTKVIIVNKEVLGVQFDFEGSRHEVKANLEVILSAGAIKTPQILMHSGVGPKKTLQKFGIPVVADLPVGKNFLCHGATVFNFASDRDLPTIMEKLQDPNNILKYINTGTGILSTPSGCFGLALLANNITAQRYDLPEYELFFYETVYGNKPVFRLSQEVYNRFFGPYLNRTIISVFVGDFFPQGKGYVTIGSSNPYDPPLINPNYYKVRENALHVVEGIKTTMRIMESHFMKELGFRPFETLMPGCEGLYHLDDYLECYVRSFVTGYHFVGTARLGDRLDPNAVVDAHLRVKGVKGLRVVDASVMPDIPRANTNNPVIMIAEKASDIIIKGYN